MDFSKIISKTRFVITVSEWEGEVLDMARISRLDMGAYLCIASNGVPPTVSKRVKVSVDCKYFRNLYILLSSLSHLPRSPSSHLQAIGRKIDKCNNFIKFVAGSAK